MYVFMFIDLLCICGDNISGKKCVVVVVFCNRCLWIRCVLLLVCLGGMVCLLISVINILVQCSGNMCSVVNSVMGECLLEIVRYVLFCFLIICVSVLVMVVVSVCICVVVFGIVCQCIVIIFFCVRWCCCVRVVCLKLLVFNCLWCSFWV